MRMGDWIGCGLAVAAVTAAVTAAAVFWRRCRHTASDFTPHTLVHTTLPVNVLVHSRPTIVEVPGFLGRAQAYALVAYAQDRFVPSVIWSSTENGNVQDAARTSDTVFFKRAECKMVRDIELAAAALCGLPVEHVEELQLVRYTCGQFFHEHHDYLDPSSKTVREHGQRLVSVLVYLNDMPPGEVGGATRFVLLSTFVRPQCGKALVWNNVTRDGKLEFLSMHAGEPIQGTHTVKYALNIWLRDRSQVQP